MLKRTCFLGERKTIPDNNTDNQKHEGSHSEKVFDRRSKTTRDDRALERRYSQNIKEGRYSVTDKIDFGSFICFMFAYLLFSFVYVIQYAN